MFSKTFEEHVDHLQAVFGRLCQHNLKLKPSKCERFKTKVSYLGHVLGISTDPEKHQLLTSGLMSSKKWLIQSRRS